MRRLLTAVVVLALLALCATATIDQTPERPLAGEELWWSLPSEVLSNVIEGKMEEISDYQDHIRRLEADLARVREIQASKLSVARPPPDE